MKMTWKLSLLRSPLKWNMPLFQVLFLIFLLFAAESGAWGKRNHEKSLHIFFVDVEGGQATLFVTPAGQSLLIDTGWATGDGRDADRIVAAAHKAGITKIDYVLITHFHDDHVGGVQQLADRISIGTFIDHGDNRETDSPGTVRNWQAYQALLGSGKYKHIIPKPGDILPIKGIHATVVSSDGALLENPLPGAGQNNSNCNNAEQFPADKSENARSLGTLIDFGKLRIVDLGDLTDDKEIQLMCPANKLGKIDIYIVSHHGAANSSSRPFVHGIGPRVAIMDNGAKKGGTLQAWNTIEKSPGLEDLWQLHFSEEAGTAANVASEFIANPDGPDTGNYLEVTANADGSFEVLNSRIQKIKQYPAR
jgi:competence protein ComEC